MSPETDGYFPKPRVELTGVPPEFEYQNLFKIDDKRPPWLRDRCGGGMLSDRDIMRLIYEGHIVIEPHPDWEKAINTNRIDLRLGGIFTRFQPIDLPAVKVTEPVPKEAILEFEREEGQEVTLHPGGLILAITKERLVVPEYLVGRLEGKSSGARLGLMVETAAWFDAGWDGRGAMELSNVGTIPLTLVVGERICSFSFEQLSSPAIKPYAKDENSQYRFQMKPIVPQALADIVLRRESG
jgi:dCTP deaminase